MEITIGTAMGRSFSVPGVLPTDKVRDVKKRIESDALIPCDSQVLVFREKQLRDDLEIGEIGIYDGARLNLIVHMTSGSGPVVKEPPPQTNDSVLMLLCKPDGLYIVEIEPNGASFETTRSIVKLSNGIPSFILDTFVKNKAKSTRHTQEDSHTESSRASSSMSSIRSSGLVSFLDFVEEDCSRPTTTNRDYKFESDSTQSDSDYEATHRSDHKSDFGAHSSTFESLLLHFESQPRQSKILGPHLTKSSTSRSTKSGSKQRPATAISIMRTKSSQTTMMVLESRPASATHIPARLKQSEPTVNTTSLSFEQQQPQDHGVCAIVKHPRNSAKSVRFAEPSLSNYGVSNEGKPATRSKSSCKPKSPQKTTTKPKYKCAQCNKKLLPTTKYICKCESVFCAFHRYSDRHTCSFDYFGVAKSKLRQENPLIEASKVRKL